MTAAALHLSPSSAPLEPGRRSLPDKLGRFALFDHIGRGGMADIYLARARTGLGGSRLVVIKEVLPKLLHSQRFADLLVAEAKLAARLSHANVVRVEDLGRNEGTLYIAMEYVEGFDLRELLRRCARDKVALPIQFSLLIVTEALRGLDYAHRYRNDRGENLAIVHRDVSPSNVLISFEGEIKLCDFGIARANDAAEELPEEAIQGKAGYMSPEHARGEPLDGRADVFAAGIILWELLSGKKLYKAGPGEKLLELARRAEVPPLPVRGLPAEEDLHAIVRRALERDRMGRYLTAATMLRDLEIYATDAQMVASPLRFGEWLMEHFGNEIVSARRSRERAMRALERGPAAVLKPIEATPQAAPAVALVVAPTEVGAVASTEVLAPTEPTPEESDANEVSETRAIRVKQASDAPPSRPSRSSAKRVSNAPTSRPGHSTAMRTSNAPTSRSSHSTAMRTSDAPLSRPNHSALGLVLRVMVLAMTIAGLIWAVTAR